MMCYYLNVQFWDQRVNVTLEHTPAINSQCWTGSDGGHHHVFCEVRSLQHTFWGIWCTVQRHPVLMYIKPGHVICNGDLSLLRIKSQDVTPWGLVDRPKQFGGTCCPLFRVQEFFPSNHEDGNVRFHQDVGTYVSDTITSHTGNTILILSTQKTQISHAVCYLLE